jgi:hypothetical protein
MLVITPINTDPKEMTMPRPTITTGLLAAATTAALAAAPAALAEADVDSDRFRGGAVRATVEGDQAGARGTITFRSERYSLSDRVVVSTTPTTIRIYDDAAVTQEGTKERFFVQLGYSLDASNPTVLRIHSGVAIRGYDHGLYDRDQAIQLGQSTMIVDSPDWSQATHAWGHLNAHNERGIDLDVHGLHFG